MTYYLWTMEPTVHHDNIEIIGRNESPIIPSPVKKRFLSCFISIVYLLIIGVPIAIGLYLKFSGSLVHSDDCSARTTPFSRLGREDGMIYWKKLRLIMKQVERRVDSTLLSDELTSIGLLNSNSPQWKALQWMVLRDPLAYDFATNLTSNSELYFSEGNTSIHEPGMRITLHQRLRQRFALAVVYYSAGGYQVGRPLLPNSGWLYNLVHDSSELKVNVLCHVPLLDECDWEGVTCNTENQHTARIGTVIGFNISTSSIFKLDKMSFPSGITLLTDLESLDMSSQGIQGTLPVEFFLHLKKLRHLDLRDNKLNRALNGKEINSGSTSQVDNFHLGLLTHLEYLSFARNDLDEAIPPLTDLTNLRELRLEGNPKLRGIFWNSAVPYWPRIEWIEIGETQLSGSIPDIDGNDSLRNLKYLSASESAITGTLPKSLAYATGLRSLKVSEPITVGLSGSLPTEYGALTDLIYFAVFNVKGLTGTLPSEYGNWRSIEILDINDNENLFGTIPSEWGRMTSLRSLKLSGNNIGGNIPSEFGTFTMLTELHLLQTQLTGTMPSEICDLRKTGKLFSLQTSCDLKQDGAAYVACPSDCCTLCWSN